MQDHVGRTRRGDLGHGQDMASKTHWRTSDDGPKLEAAQSIDRLSVELTAAVIALDADQPVVLVRPDANGGPACLPSEHYRPTQHGALVEAIRNRVVAQTDLELGYIEQLSTDCDADADDEAMARVAGAGRAQRHLSIGYLALIRVEGSAAKHALPWTCIYDFFPWEDWRKGRAAILTTLEPKLVAWAQSETDDERQGRLMSRHDRVRMMFGLDGGKWDDERVLERLEILEQSGLVGIAAEFTMRPDHYRILATALSRLRAKIRNRPLVFELLPPVFTLFELQKTVEAILGPHLHKQNFRRLVEGTGLVEPTGDVRTHTGGRPAKLFRFRREVLLERPAPGVRIKAGRAA